MPLLLETPGSSSSLFVSIKPLPFTMMAAFQAVTVSERNYVKLSQGFSKNSEIMTMMNFIISLVDTFQILRYQGDSRANATSALPAVGS